MAHRRRAIVIPVRHRSDDGGSDDHNLPTMNDSGEIDVVKVVLAYYEMHGSDLDASSTRINPLSTIPAQGEARSHLCLDWSFEFVVFCCLHYINLLK